MRQRGLIPLICILYIVYIAELILAFHACFTSHLRQVCVEAKEKTTVTRSLSTGAISLPVSD